MNVSLSTNNCYHWYPKLETLPNEIERFIITFLSSMDQVHLRASCKHFAKRISPISILKKSILDIPYPGKEGEEWKKVAIATLDSSKPDNQAIAKFYQQAHVFSAVGAFCQFLNATCLPSFGLEFRFLTTNSFTSKSIVFSVKKGQETFYHQFPMPNREKATIRSMRQKAIEYFFSNLATPDCELDGYPIAGFKKWQDSNNQSLLHKAVLLQCWDCVHVFIDQAKMKDSSGKTAFDYANENVTLLNQTSTN